MTDERRDPIEVTELDDSELEAVAGGEDNEVCPNNGCHDGCSPNVGCNNCGGEKIA
jgi:hypothetical protein